jgi:hypothetical protein
VPANQSGLKSNQVEPLDSSSCKRGEQDDAGEHVTDGSEASVFAC